MEAVKMQKLNSEDQLSLEQYLIWMLDQIRIGNEPTLFYNNYVNCHSKGLENQIGQEAKEYFDVAFLGEYRNYMGINKL
jgi:hypothetical protein